MKKILHWLACHTVIIVLLLFVVIAVFFRGPLFGIWSESEPEPETATAPLTQAPTEQVLQQPVEQAVEPQAPIEPETMKPPVSAEQQTTDQEPVSVQAGVQPEMPAAQQTEATPAASLDNRPDTVSEPAEAVEPENEPDTSRLPATAIQRTKPETLQQEENYQFRPPQAEPYQPAAEDAEDLLQQARKAYWNDELDKSKSLYEQYIDANPENPDGYGELGNLLSTMGDLDRAAEMYRKAAELLSNAGNIEQAQRLQEVLSSIEIIQSMPE